MKWAKRSRQDVTPKNPEPKLSRTPYVDDQTLTHTNQLDTTCDLVLIAPVCGMVSKACEACVVVLALAWLTFALELMDVV